MLRRHPAETLLRDKRRIGADHHQLAMGHIDDAHQPEDDRQSQRHDQRIELRLMPRNIVSIAFDQTPRFRSARWTPSRLAPRLLLRWLASLGAGLDHFFQAPTPLLTAEFAELSPAAEPGSTGSFDASLTALQTLPSRTDPPLVRSPAAASSHGMAAGLPARPPVRRRRSALSAVQGWSVSPVLEEHP